MRQLIMDTIATVRTSLLSLLMFAMALVCSASCSFADETQNLALADREAIAIFRSIKPSNLNSAIGIHHCNINSEWTRWAIPGELAKKYLKIDINADLVSPHAAPKPEDLLGEIFKDSNCQFGQPKFPDKDEKPSPENPQDFTYAYIDLSYPIFDHGYKRALVVYSRALGRYIWTGDSWDRRTAGGGDVLIFEKKNGIWSEITHEELWIE